MLVIILAQSSAGRVCHDGRHSGGDGGDLRQLSRERSLLGIGILQPITIVVATIDHRILAIGSQETNH